jgi:hypothetical protein
LKTKHQVSFKILRPTVSSKLINGNNNKIDETVLILNDFFFKNDDSALIVVIFVFEDDHSGLILVGFC